MAKQGMKISKSLDICGNFKLNDMAIEIDGLGVKSLNEVLKMFDGEVVKIKVGLVEEITE